MSKQSEAKKRQNYNPKPELDTCSNCANFASDVEFIRGTYGSYREEKNLRCAIGGFKVMKRGTCSIHNIKESEA